MADGFPNVPIDRAQASPHTAQPARPTHAEAIILNQVLHAVRRIRHGQVQLHIQDGKVVQIDQTEKLRLPGK